MYETRLGADQLAALAAVIEFGSFDTAAERPARDPIPR